VRRVVSRGIDVETDRSFTPALFTRAVRDALTTKAPIERQATLLDELITTPQIKRELE
jgi:hypothetical protein